MLPAPGTVCSVVASSPRKQRQRCNDENFKAALEDLIGVREGCNGTACRETSDRVSRLKECVLRTTAFCWLLVHL